MQFHSTFLCCVVFLVPCSSSLESNYSGEIPVEQSITTEDESSQELSSQLLEVDSRSGGWSAWTQWSSCSRTCDGGVSRQFRTCHHDTCRGERMRYKICNMQIFALYCSLSTFCSSAIVRKHHKLIQGPNTKTVILSQDTLLESTAPAGQIYHEGNDGYIDKFYTKSLNTEEEYDETFPSTINSHKKVIAGPSTNSTIVGPDGSIIRAFAPGEKIIYEGSEGSISKRYTLIDTDTNENVVLIQPSEDNTMPPKTPTEDVLPATEKFEFFKLY